MRIFTSTILIALLLIATMGIPVSKHYCMGELVNTQIGNGPVDCCGMIEANNMPNGCCGDDFQFYQIDEDYAQSFDAENLRTFPTLIVHAWFTQLLHNKVVRVKTAYLNYKPPLIVRDIHIEQQRFLC